MSDILHDFNLRFVIDDTSDNKGLEYRCSVYDEDTELVSDGWGATPLEATIRAIEHYEIE